MKNQRKRLLQVCVLCAALLFPGESFALSTGHHLYNMSRRLCETIGGPFYGIFIQGPKNIKKAYHAEVWEQEKPENQGLLCNKIFGIYRAPGEEAKGIINGITDSVYSLGQACIEFISIFFGD